jgi:peptide/nickel transport system ATP-binding protein
MQVSTGERSDIAVQPTPPLLEVSRLRAYFQGDRGVVRAVDGIDLTVDRGEVVGLVGESGCGKSATAQAILRLLRPPGRAVGGSVLLDGEDLMELSERRMASVRGGRVAMLFQHPKATLDPTCRVGDHVAEPLRLHRGMGKKEAWDRAVELLGMVGIPDPARRAKAYPHQLSGGMAQRVMIATALSGEPDLLIADEPTTALDVTVQAQILRLLKELCERLGLGVLIITHDFGVIASLADRVYVMYAGRVVEQGAVERVLLEPQHPYTEALLRCCVSSEHPDRELFVIGGSVPALTEPTINCAFADRCHVKGELGDQRCDTKEPGMFAVGSGHLSRCWRAEVEA